MSTYLLRLWLPDRPGALGAVASRIGSVGADVIGIEVLEQGAGRAIDELLLRIPHEERIGLLLTELTEVDGVSVEDLREVPGERAERGVDVLELVASLVEHGDPDGILPAMLEALVPRFDLDWAAVADLRGSSIVCTLGEAPAPEWLTGYAAGMLGDTEAVDRPTDVADALLGTSDLVLLAGRTRYALHERERRELRAVARICASVGLGVADARS